MSRTLFLSVAAALVITLSSSAAPQDRPGPGIPAAPPSATGLIVGQVVDAHTGRGIAGAVVSLSAGPGAAIGAGAAPLAPAGNRLRVLATSEGRFVFRDLAPGMYTVTARKAGYIEGAHGHGGPAVRRGPSCWPRESEPQQVQRSASSGTPTTIIQSGATMIVTTAPGGSAGPPAPDEPVLWARVPVQVEETSLTNLEIPLHVGGRIGGRLVFDGAAPRPPGEDLTRILVIVESADGLSTRIPPIRVDRVGRFTSPGLAGGRYVVRAAGAPSEWTFKGAMLDGRDVSDVPLEHGGSDVTSIAITFTDRPATLAGVVRSPQGAPDPDATVLAFPSDPRLWIGYGATRRRFRAARSRTDGAYTIAGLPPGSYGVVAVPDELTADWQDPARLEVFARQAARIRIPDGQTHTQDLTTER